MIYSFSKFGLQVRLVNESDATFITMLRKDEQLSRFVHHVDGGVEEQVSWIKSYKEREKIGKEIYFIFIENNVPMGVYRIYNILDDSVTIGSWMFKRDASPNSSIKADIIVKDFCFDNFLGHKVLFDVRRLNHSVNRYHLRYKPIKIAEDELDIHYELVYENYIQGRDKMLKFLEIV